MSTINWTDNSAEEGIEHFSFTNQDVKIIVRADYFDDEPKSYKMVFNVLRSTPINPMFQIKKQTVEKTENIDAAFAAAERMFSEFSTK